MIEEISRFYRQLDASSVAQLDNLYAENTVFVDPVTHLEGLDALKKYFHQLLENTSSCQFEITQVTEANNQYFLIWTMTFSHPRLKAGEEVKVEGISHLQVENNKIVHHRDYYDMGEMLYEQVPVLGFVIRKLKGRLHA